MPEKRKHITNEEMIALGRKLGVEVTVTTKSPGTGEIAPLPGVRAIPDERRADLLTDDDGSVVVE